MTLIESILFNLRQKLGRVQSKLSFEGWWYNPQFANNKGLGRVACLGSLFGILWGIHVVLASLLLLWRFEKLSLSEVVLVVGNERMTLLWQWSGYVVVLSTFHLAEFFVTLFYNPSVATSDSFLLNQSPAYTAAALLSWFEFWVRFLFFPGLNNTSVVWFGVALVVASQILRSIAMMTAGESFNHLIQSSKKENHILITHGIYKYLRHPSYVGFYYWAVGTQMILCNFVHVLLYALAAWHFFNRRIPFEEQSLLLHFPNEYPAYAARTWSGIPFIRTRIGASTVGQ